MKFWYDVKTSKYFLFLLLTKKNSGYFIAILPKNGIFLYKKVPNIFLAKKSEKRRLLLLHNQLVRFE